MKPEEFRINSRRKGGQRLKMYINEGYYSEEDLVRFLHQLNRGNRVAPYTINAGEEPQEQET